jgi:hypothetical protein
VYDFLANIVSTYLLCYLIDNIGRKTDDGTTDDA